MKLDSVTDALVDLAPLTKIGSGKQRDVYLWPATPEQAETGPLVLKVPRYGERDSRLTNGKKLLRRIAPSSAHRIITKEAQYACELARRYRDDERPPIPNFYGYVETTEGWGVLWEAICTETGAPAPTLRHMAARGKISDWIDTLNRFTRSCFDKNIVACDLHAGNLVCVERDSSRQIILIDGYGDHRMFSMRAIWPQYNTRHLIKRFERVARQTGLAFDPVTSEFALPPDAAPAVYG